MLRRILLSSWGSLWTSHCRGERGPSLLFPHFPFVLFCQPASVSDPAAPKQGDEEQWTEWEFLLYWQWKDWCWSWNSNILATWCEELAHLKRPWCWERLKAGGEGDDRGWDGWMASLTRWTWVWVDSGSWWWTGRPGVLQFMGLQRVGHNWVTGLNWTGLMFFWDGFALWICQVSHLASSLVLGLGALLSASAISSQATGIIVLYVPQHEQESFLWLTAHLNIQVCLLTLHWRPFAGIPSLLIS